MRQKLADARGETLVEVLASILIGALSVAMLFSAAMASGSMDRTAGEADEVFNTSLNAAEEQKAPTEGEVTVKYTPPPGSTDPAPPDPPPPVRVNFYGGPGALSYALK